MRSVKICIALILVTLSVSAQVERDTFDFEFESVILKGILNTPAINPPKGIVLLVHGSGRTNAIEQEWYYDIRETLVKSGYACYMWDKMGCGMSGGTFNYNQSAQNSAMEVIAAINSLKVNKIAGSQEIGLWGISRAGWINPIVINEHKDIKFWISVSGVDEKENFNYLFEENLRINGKSEDTIRLLVNELKEGVRISYGGGDFDTYMKATKNLRKNEFLDRFNNGNVITEEGYYEYQKTFMDQEFDEASGLAVYVPKFDSLLSNIQCPTLALFGENDRNVDWKKTKLLYEHTLGNSTQLTIESFNACNHNMFISKTGGFYEFEVNNLPWKRCEGFLESTSNWLQGIE